MSIALLVAGCVLAALFLLAAVSKLVDLDRFRLALEDFGAPPRLIRPLAWAIPALELAIAVLLLPAATAQGAAIGAMALLTVFSVVIARALRQGVEADCGCFGGRSSPASPTTLARNAGLIVLAAPVAVGGHSDSLGGLDISGPIVLAAIALAATAVLAVFCWQLFRQNGRLLERVRAIEAGLEQVLRSETQENNTSLAQLEVQRVPAGIEMDRVEERTPTGRM